MNETLAPKAEIEEVPAPGTWPEQPSDDDTDDGDDDSDDWEDEEPQEGHPFQFPKVDDPMMKVTIFSLRDGQLVRS